MNYQVRYKTNDSSLSTLVTVDQFDSREIALSHAASIFNGGVTVDVQYRCLVGPGVTIALLTYCPTVSRNGTSHLTM